MFVLLFGGSVPLVDDVVFSVSLGVLSFPFPFLPPVGGGGGGGVFDVSFVDLHLIGLICTDLCC